MNIIVAEGIKRLDHFSRVFAFSRKIQRVRWQRNLLSIGRISRWPSACKLTRYREFLGRNNLLIATGCWSSFDPSNPPLNRCWITVTQPRVIRLPSSSIRQTRFANTESALIRQTVKHVVRMYCTYVRALRDLSTRCIIKCTLATWRQLGKLVCM